MQHYSKLYSSKVETSKITDPKSTKNYLFPKFSKSGATIFNLSLSKKKDRRINGNNTIRNAILSKSKPFKTINRTKIDHLLFLYISIFTLAYCSFLIAREGSVNRARQPSRTVLMKANKVARG